jgi:hypothetical protein
MTHTPTPWAEPVYDNDDFSSAEWWEIEGVARFLNLEDVKLARKAVNSHDKLVEALREMVEMMDSGDEHGEGSEWHRKAKAALEGLE